MLAQIIIIIIIVQIEKQIPILIHAWPHCRSCFKGSAWMFVLPQFGYSLCKSLLFISIYVSDSVYVSFYLIFGLRCPEPHRTSRDRIDRNHGTNSETLPLLLLQT